MKINAKNYIKSNKRLLINVGEKLKFLEVLQPAYKIKELKKKQGEKKHECSKLENNGDSKRENR